MKKVVKFGGSSLASASQFEKVGAIIRGDESRRYVVPSAPGKRFSGDTKVTDLLYACYRSVGDEEKFQKILNEIKERYQEIIDGLHLSLSLEEDFSLVEENFKKQIGEEYAASRGEYLNGKIMAAYLGFTLCRSGRDDPFLTETASLTERSQKNWLPRNWAVWNAQWYRILRSQRRWNY